MVTVGVVLTFSGFLAVGVSGLVILGSEVTADLGGVISDDSDTGVDFTLGLADCGREGGEINCGLDTVDFSGFSSDGDSPEAVKSVSFLAVVEDFCGGG